MGRKWVMKKMPYTKEDLAAAEAWMDEVGFEAGMIDTEDLPEITESLAIAMARHVADQVRSGQAGEEP